MSTQSAESSRSQVCWIKSGWAARACRCSTCPLPKGHSSHSTAPSFRPRSPNWGQTHLAKSCPKKPSSQLLVSSANRDSHNFDILVCPAYNSSDAGFSFPRQNLPLLQERHLDGRRDDQAGKRRLLVTVPFSKTRGEQIEQMLGQRRRRRLTFRLTSGLTDERN